MASFFHSSAHESLMPSNLPAVESYPIIVLKPDTVDNVLKDIKKESVSGAKTTTFVTAEPITGGRKTHLAKIKKPTVEGVGKQVYLYALPNLTMQNNIKITTDGNVICFDLSLHQVNGLSRANACLWVSASL